MIDHKEIAVDALFLHVKQQSEYLVQRVRVWLAHPSYDTKTALRTAMSEVDGMWRMAYALNGHAQCKPGTVAAQAQSAWNKAHTVLENLDGLKAVWTGESSVLQAETDEMLRLMRLAQIRR